jgi:hypothetical protein
MPLPSSGQMNFKSQVPNHRNKFQTKRFEILTPVILNLFQDLTQKEKKRDAEPSSA